MAEGVNPLLRIFLLKAVLYSFKGVGVLLLFAYIFSFGFLVFLPLLQQITGWLNTAEWLPRDLYWFIAEPKCFDTNWVAMGWTGKDICRVDEIQFTNMAGLNLLLNWFVGLHISIIWLICSSLLLVPGAKFYAWYTEKYDELDERIERLELDHGALRDTTFAIRANLVWEYFFRLVVGVPVLVFVFAIFYAWINDGFR
ncbi:hypothetical protein OAR36_06770 [Pseudomonadales bacterium]|nr:hypothetical protein [Pseudomonadales bacterium]